MTSQFYQDRLERRFPVTMLFLECVSAIPAGDADGSEKALRDVLAKALADAGLVKGKPNSEDLMYALKRLTEMRQQHEGSGEEESEPTSSKKSFGSDYLNWLTEMDHQNLCFHVAGYDLQEARRLYCEEDYETVVALSRQKADSDWHDRVGWFEASLFGFGGGYGKDTDGQEYDLKKNRASAESALKAAGF